MCNDTINYGVTSDKREQLTSFRNLPMYMKFHYALFYTLTSILRFNCILFEAENFLEIDYWNVQLEICNVSVFLLLRK